MVIDPELESLLEGSHYRNRGPKVFQIALAIAWQLVFNDEQSWLYGGQGYLAGMSAFNSDRLLYCFPHETDFYTS